MSRNGFAKLGLGFLALASMTSSGCLSGDDLEDILDELDDIEFRIGNEVDIIQTEDPRFINLPPPLIDSGDTIIINNDVTIINDIHEDIIIDELPDQTILGFENLTGLDGYYQYLADGVLQGIFVFDGESLLLDYPCLSDVELLSEDYFDPFTGELVESFDDSGSLFVNPFDFECGDLFLFTFDIDGVFAGVEPIDLLN